MKRPTPWKKLNGRINYINSLVPKWKMMYPFWIWMKRWTTWYLQCKETCRTTQLCKYVHKLWIPSLFSVFGVGSVSACSRRTSPRPFAGSARMASRQTIGPCLLSRSSSCLSFCSWFVLSNPFSLVHNGFLGYVFFGCWVVGVYICVCSIRSYPRQGVHYSTTLWPPPHPGIFCCGRLTNY